jgi:hypothetical protein
MKTTDEVITLSRRLSAWNRPAFLQVLERNPTHFIFAVGIRCVGEESEGSGQGCPLLRASSDHRFIVGALRARRPYQLSRHPLCSGSKGAARVSFRCSLLIRTILVVAWRAVLRRKD